MAPLVVNAGRRSAKLSAPGPAFQGFERRIRPSTENGMVPSVGPQRVGKTLDLGRLVLIQPERCRTFVPVAECSSKTAPDIDDPRIPGAGEERGGLKRTRRASPARRPRRSNSFVRHRLAPGGAPIKKNGTNHRKRLFKVRTSHFTGKGCGKLKNPSPGQANSPGGTGRRGTGTGC